MKKLNVCSGGGFARLQVILLEEQETKCEICRKMLDIYKFKSDDLQAMVQKYLEGFIEGSELIPEVPQADSTKNEPDDEEETLDQLPLPKRQRSCNDSAAIKAWIAELDPVIELLPAGTFDKKVPYRCTLCRTKKWPDGKVGDAVEWKLNSIKNFIGNHLKSEAHKRAVREAEAFIYEPQPKLACEGISTCDPITGDKLHDFAEEFEQWASMANFSEHARHTYIKEANTNSWTIFHSDCEKQVIKDNLASEGGRLACPKCMELGGRRGIVRTVTRFAFKYFAAQLLHIRLYNGDAAVDKLKRNIRASKLYETFESKVEELLKLDNAKLQQWVRASWMSDSRATKTMIDFMNVVIRPCLDVNVASVPDNLGDVSAKFAAILAGGSGFEFSWMCPPILSILQLQT